MNSLITPQLGELIKNKNTEEIQKLVSSLSGYEIAALISKMSLQDRLFVFNGLSAEKAAQTFDYLPQKAQKQLLHLMPCELTAAMLAAMPPDDRTALFEKLPQNVVDEYVKLLPKEERVLTLKLLGYPKYQVGRVMTTDYIAVKMDWTIEQVLDYIREHGHDRETIDVIYVIDDHDMLTDDIRLKELLFHPKETRINQIADNKFLSLCDTDKVDDAIKVFREHNRVALPVVNHEGLMLGIVTIDDILRIASRKNTTAIQKIGGSEALDEPYMETPFLELTKKRARWLVLLFVGELFTATAMGYFEEEISKAVVLALFLPLIISSGGNAGSQSSTLIIRAMALREVKLSDWWRVMRWEILLGASLGLILGIVGFARVSIWGSLSSLYGEHWLLIALTIFSSLIGVVLWGSLAGAMLPFILKRAGFDPATSSAPLVATIVDVTGIVIYFTVAMTILKGTLL